MKKTCIMYGNCNVDVLNALMLQVPEFADVYRTVYVKRLGEPTAERPHISTEDVKSCSLLLYQVRHWEPVPVIRDELSQDCRIISFPILWNQSLWPLHCKDPRNQVEPGFPSGRYPYGDSLALQLLRKGLKPEDVLEAYMETDINKMIDLDLLHEANVEKGSDLDSKSDLPLNGFMEENFRHRRLFWCFNHPTPLLLLPLAGLILQELGMGGVPDEISRRTLEDPPLSHLHIPIHPQVARHFQVGWADEDTKYRYFDIGWFTFSEYLQRYLAFA